MQSAESTVLRQPDLTRAAAQHVTLQALAYMPQLHYRGTTAATDNNTAGVHVLQACMGRGVDTQEAEAGSSSSSHWAGRRQLECLASWGSSRWPASRHSQLAVFLLLLCYCGYLMLGV